MFEQRPKCEDAANQAVASPLVLESLLATNCKLICHMKKRQLLALADLD